MQRHYGIYEHQSSWEREMCAFRYSIIARCIEISRVSRHDLGRAVLVRHKSQMTCSTRVVSSVVGGHKGIEVVS